MGIKSTSPNVTWHAPDLHYFPFDLSIMLAWQVPPTQGPKRYAVTTALTMIAHVVVLKVARLLMFKVKNEM